jgi:hypothetical protein
MYQKRKDGMELSTVLRSVVGGLGSCCNFRTYLARMRVFDLLMYTDLRTAESSASLTLPPLLLLPRTALVTPLLRVRVSD